MTRHPTNYNFTTFTYKMKTANILYIVLGVLVAITVLITALKYKRDQSKQKTLYERLGGVYSIAAVVDHFSDALVENPVVGKDSQNEFLSDWHHDGTIALNCKGTEAQYDDMIQVYMKFCLEFKNNQVQNTNCDSSNPQ